MHRSPNPFEDIESRPKPCGERLFQHPARSGVHIDNADILLKSDKRYFALKLPENGHYTLEASLERDGETLAASTLPICRAIPRTRGKPTILGISDAYEYDRIAAAGGTWDRIPFSLRATVKDASGVRSLVGSNPLPQTLPSLGCKRVAAAFAMPKWLSRASDKVDFHRYGPRDWSEFKSLVKWTAAEMMNAGVTHYEVWNEASAIGHWNEDMETLIKLHEVTYEAVKEVAPHMMVLGGCTHSWTFDFLRSFLRSGGGDHCDGLAVHGYTYQPWDRVDHFDKLVSLIEEYAPDRPDFKAHITEIGFRTPAFSLDDQAKFFALYTLEAASRSRIAAILWFRYINPRPEILSGYRQDSSAGYGLVGNGNSYCRPAFATYRFVERVLQVFDEVRGSGSANDRRYDFLLRGEVKACASENVIETEGWASLDHYGGPSSDAGGIRFHFSPDVLHLVR